MRNPLLPDTRFENLIRLVQIARGLEAGGFYNASKLFWALAFSEEIRASSQAGVTNAVEELDETIESVLRDLRESRVSESLLDALKAGRQGALENRTIPASEIPEVSVCRTCGEIVVGKVPERCPSCSALAVTFREFMPVYWLEPLQPQEVMDALAAAPGAIENAASDLSEEQMALCPLPGEWSIRDVFWHLLVAEELFALRIEKMVEEHNPILESVAAWAIGTGEKLSAREILHRYHTSRLATVERLKEIPLQDWWRTGQHEEFGQVTILQQASYFAKHEGTHLPQIESIRRAIGA